MIRKFYTMNKQGQSVQIAQLSLNVNGTGSGWWEYRDGTEGGELHCEKLEIVDFDGAAFLPRYVAASLEACGIAAKECTIDGNC